MANRYWVGGTGNWDATTTNWSATSGGAGGASVPTSVDDVFFDTLSNATAYVVTLLTAPVCRSVSVAGPATGNVTIAGSAAWSIYGGLTVAATGVTWTNTSTISLRATTTGWTITTNGVTLTNGIIFNGAGGEWTLGSALTITSASGVTHTQGAFATANFNFTISGTFTSTSALTRSVTLGSSTVTCANWNALGATNLTVNAGTSTITVTSAAGTFNGGSLTYYNVTRANNGFAIGDANNTFNALTNTTVTVNQTLACTFVGNQTIGAFTVNGGSAPTQRMSIQSATPGVQIILTVTSFVTNGYIDFRDINLQGAASPLTVATGGNAGNNLNITLQTPKTVYWNFAAGGNWNITTAWALTSGGVPAAANYPLPQDTAIIQDTGLNSGATITIATNAFGTMDVSTRTLPMTLSAAGSFPTVYGNLTLSSAVTTGTGTFTFAGYNKTQTFTSAGVSVAFGVTVNGTSTTFALGGALTMTAQFVLTLGTLNLANNNLTTTNFNSTNTNTRSITFGTGQINVTGNSGFLINMDNMTGFTYTGSGTFNYTYSGSTGFRAVIFGNAGGATESNALNINFTAGTDQAQIYGGGFRNINLTGFAGTWIEAGTRTIYGDLVISTGTTITATTFTTFAATSGVQNITSNGKTITFPITKFGAGTLRLVDALTLGSTLTFTLTTGTFDLNAQTATMGLFSSTGSNVRSIAFNGGTMVVSGATFTASGSNFTTTGSGAICMTRSSTKTFAGGGFSYPTLSQDGPAPGPLVITGANTFNNVTNGILNPGIPATIIFPSSTTTTVSNFTAGGTSFPSLIAVESNVAGTAATVNYVGSSAVFANYLSIQDFTATPSPRWQANTATTTIVSNVTGWNVTNFYYWVGGTGNWDATNTQWAATSGGAGGAGVPTLADNVFFDSASNATAYVCTLTTTPVCASVNIAGPASGNVTIAGSAGWSIYGNMFIAATGVTWTHTGTIFFVATTAGWTVTTNGVAMGAITRFGGGAGGGGGGWTLGSAFTSSTGIQFQNGTLTTNNFSMTTGNNFDSTLLTFARTLNLGSSSITCQAWLGGTVASGLTLNAGTSTITLTGSTGIFNGGGQTYYNVTKANNGFTIGDGGNTFNALTNTTNTTNGTYLCSFAGNQTIGTLTINGGTNQVQRTSIQTPSTLAGTQVTLTVATFVTNGYIDFRDINFQGAASPLTVATGGDCGNNTNITLQTPKTVYWSFVAGANWVGTVWATSSGGAPSLANFPLPQDTAIIDDTGLTSGNTITINVSPNVGTINMSTRTLPMTFTLATGQISSIYGDLILSSAVTSTATTGTFIFSGFNKTQTITSAGITVGSGITVNGRLTTVALGGALTTAATTTFTLTLGTLNLANNNLTCGLFSTTNTNTRAITFGTGQIYLTGNNGTIWNFNAGSGLTVTGSAIVNATYSGATGTRLFLGYAVGSAVINVNVTAGTDIVAMNNVGFNNINFTGFTGSVITGIGGTGNITLGAGMTITSAAAWSMFGTSGTQLFTSNGVTLDAPLTFNGVGGAYQLQDNLTLGSTRVLTLSASTLNLNGKNLLTGTFAATGTLVRSVSFNGGTMTVLGATFTASGSNFTTTGPGIINMTSASSKTFAGNGLSYPTLNQGGAGTLIITGANTFRTIANTVAPSTITLPASTTTSVAGFDLLGTLGNLVTLNSSTAGTQATLNNTTGGRIGGDYLSYRDINATPANTISAGANSTSVSNNTGWLTTPVVFGAAAESVTVADAQDGIRGQFGSVADAVTLTNTQSALAAFAPQVAELLTLIDIIPVQNNWVGYTAETIVFTDTQIQRGWIKINNSQTPNWTSIDDSQG